ncbi:hypothetical protein CAOG_005634 [Capsaspora owczarzaki ATCC 30864]|uniref:Rubisco LSMT substrate-binding domain-containing protein n=1 Tax=Capsaspora owczarzaki (strain ATCC 30864) TaxID=595528 RepID=A0A0D2WTV3_CAPO3|nr:hypothetical protein CAOG_005634 [Capsaspora owczarzaki ATCC 30864]
MSRFVEVERQISAVLEASRSNAKHDNNESNDDDDDACQTAMASMVAAASALLGAKRNAISTARAAASTASAASAGISSTWNADLLAALAEDDELAFLEHVEAQQGQVAVRALRVCAWRARQTGPFKQDVDAHLALQIEASERRWSELEQPAVARVPAICAVAMQRQVYAQLVNTAREHLGLSASTLPSDREWLATLDNVGLLDDVPDVAATAQLGTLQPWLDTRIDRTLAWMDLNTEKLFVEDLPCVQWSIPDAVRVTLPRILTCHGSDALVAEQRLQLLMTGPCPRSFLYSKNADHTSSMTPVVLAILESLRLMRMTADEVYFENQLEHCRTTLTLQGGTFDGCAVSILNLSNERQAVTSLVQLCNTMMAATTAPASATFVQVPDHVAKYIELVHSTYEHLRNRAYEYWTAVIGTRPAALESRKIGDNLLQWLHNAGMTSIAENHLSIADFEHTGRGVLANERIEAGVEVLHLPQHLLINIHVALDESHPIGRVLSDLRDEYDDDTLLLLYVLHEKLVAGSASRWAPFFETLPATYNSPLLFHVTELLELEGTRLIDETFEIKDGLRVLHESLGPLAEAYPALFPTDAFTYENLLWVRAMIDSRAMKLPVPAAAAAVAAAAPEDATETPFVANLIPFVDMINHEEHSHISVRRYDTSAKALVLTTLGACAAGTQLSLHYSTLPSWQQLLYYGMLSTELNPLTVTVDVYFTANNPDESSSDADTAPAAVVDDEEGGDDESDTAMDELDADLNDDEAQELYGSYFDQGPIAKWMDEHFLPRTHTLARGMHSSLLLPCVCATVLSAEEFEAVREETLTLLALQSESEHNEAANQLLRRQVALDALSNVSEDVRTRATESIASVLTELMEAFGTTAEEDSELLADSAQTDDSEMLSVNRTLAIRYRRGIKLVIADNLDKANRGDFGASAYTYAEEDGNVCDYGECN